MSDDHPESATGDGHALVANLPVSLRAMIFARDRTLVAAFADAVADLPLDWVLVDDNSLAEQFIIRDRFDCLLVDCGTDGGAHFISQARRCECNHACVIFAIAPGVADDALLQLGADVYLNNPGELPSLGTCITEALPLMKHDRRRSRRCPVSIPASLQRGDDTTPITVLTLSEGGMMIHVKHDVPDYNVLRIHFVPAGTAEMHLYGKIAWRGPDCLAGIRFLGLTHEEKQALADLVRAQPVKAAYPTGQGES